MTRPTPPKRLPSIDELRRYLSYDPDTGHFTWICKYSAYSRVIVGERAGCLDHLRYRPIRVAGHTMKAHRLAWAFVHGCWPEDMIDHINGITDDNRIANLRAASRAQHNHNAGPHRRNKCGVRGVCWNRATQKWRAHMDRIYLGAFDDFDEAVAARKKAEQQHHGEFRYRE